MRVVSGSNPLLSTNTSVLLAQFAHKNAREDTAWPAQAGQRDAAKFLWNSEQAEHDSTHERISADNLQKEEAFLLFFVSF